MNLIYLWTHKVVQGCFVGMNLELKFPKAGNIYMYTNEEFDY